MQNKIDKYNLYQENLEKQKKDFIKFLTIISDFRKLDYDGRINYFKNNYGNLEEKTIFFGENCKLVITFGKDKKYHFYFECLKSNIEIFNEIFPELSEFMKNGSVNEIKKLYPEVLYYYFPQEEIQNEFNSEYINSYNNIHINNRKK